MKTAVAEITVTELQQAIRDYCEKHYASQVNTVHVTNGYGKTVLDIPLAMRAVVTGVDFKRATDEI